MYVREIEKWILPWHKLNIELGLKKCNMIEHGFIIRGMRISYRGKGSLN
jgi:hypothetical protein